MSALVDAPGKSPEFLKRLLAFGPIDFVLPAFTTVDQ
jgi:hypothetical protein